MANGVAKKFYCQKELQFGIFFDGTGNNRDVDKKKTKLYLKRLEGRKYYPLPSPKFTSSLSNVAKLYELFKENDGDDLYKVYIPGVGTPFDPNNEGEDDGFLGAVFGYGGSARICYAFWTIYSKILKKEGIQGTIPWEQNQRPGKIENEVDTLPERLDEDLKKSIQAASKTSRLCKITLYVFGFSRGAAEARCFVNRLSRLSDSTTTQLKFGGIDVEVKFLGIFDTVASVGVVDIKSFRGNGMLPSRFGESVDGHGFWAIAKNLVVPENVPCVHYIAGNEARACFPLTMTENKGKHKVKLYPGAHSDVGGGYGFMEQGKYDMSVVPGRDMYDEAVSSGTPFKDLMPYNINQMKLDNAHTLYGEILAHHDFFTAYNAVKGDMDKMLEDIGIPQESVGVFEYAKNIAQYNQSYLVYRGTMLRRINPPNDKVAEISQNSSFQTQTRTWYGAKQQVPRYEWQQFYLRAIRGAEATEAQESDKKIDKSSKVSNLQTLVKGSVGNEQKNKSEGDLLQESANDNSVIGLKVVNDLLEEGLSVFNRRWLSTFGNKHSYHPTIKGILEKYRKRQECYSDEKNDEYEDPLKGKKAIKQFYNDYVHDSQASFYIGMGMLEYSGRCRYKGTYITIPLISSLFLGNGQGLARYRGIYRIEGNTAIWMKYEPEGDISQHIGLNGKAN